MEIRPATAADVPGVLPMVRAISALHAGWDAARFKTVEHPEKLYESWLIERSADPRSIFIVAEQGGQIIAYTVCTIQKEIPIYVLQETGWVHDLWVDENYRNEGIGRQMVMLVIEQFKNMGVQQIRLQTAGVNEIARKLFTSCGFRISTIEMLTEI